MEMEMSEMKAQVQVIESIKEGEVVSAEEIVAETSEIVAAPPSTEESLESKIGEIVDEIVEMALESASAAAVDEKEEVVEEAGVEAPEEVAVDATQVIEEVVEAETEAVEAVEEDVIEAQEDEEFVVVEKEEEDVVVQKEEIDISLPSDLVEKEAIAEPNLDNVAEEEEEEELEEVSVAKPLVRKPTARHEKDGPAVPISQIQQAVFRTNPLHDEILFTIESCAKNDASLTKIEIVDYHLTHKQVTALSEALSSNTVLKVLVLDGCGIQTAAGQLLAKALVDNKSIEKVSLERNALGPQAMKDFAKMIGRNSTIKEFRLGTQASITPMGLEAEQFFAEGMQKNETIVKLSLVCKSAHCRNQVDRAVTRNKEYARKARVAAAAAASAA